MCTDKPFIINTVTWKKKKKKKNCRFWFQGDFKGKWVCSPKLTGRQKWITIYSIETTQHTYTAIMESSLQFLGNRSNKKHNLWVIIKARVLRDLCHQQKKCVTKLQEITEERDCFVCVCGSEGFLRNQICTGMFGKCLNKIIIKNGEKKWMNQKLT